ncbi:MAG: hypothetical protein LBG64_02200 [Pseudomonadales bacterium]|nr:hypothetical protein [Pseudomonadales bacterium]
MSKIFVVQLQIGAVNTAIAEMAKLDYEVSSFTSHYQPQINCGPDNRDIMRHPESFVVMMFTSDKEESPIIKSDDDFKNHTGLTPFHI